MGAVGLVARADASRRWPGLVGLAVIVAVVGAVVMATAAGARRTDDAFDRFLEASRSRDAGVLAFTLGEPEVGEALQEAVAGSEGVQATGRVLLYSTDAGTEFDLGLLVDPDGVAFRAIDRPRVLEGRMPAVDDAEEIVVNEQVASGLDLAPGDLLPVHFFSPADCEALAEGRFLGFNSREVGLEVVGVIRLAEDLQGGGLRSTTAVGSPAFTSVYADDACATGIGVSMRLDDGADLGAIQAATLAAAPDSDPVLMASEDEFVGTTRSAIDVAVTALTAFGAVAAAAGVLAASQAVSRQVAPSRSDVETLAAVGLDRRQRTVVAALPSLVATTAGTAAAVALAIAASPLFPVGVAADAEPDPGVAVDGLVLGLGGLGLLMVTTVTAVGLAHRRVGGDLRADADHRSVVASWVSRAGAGPVAVTGLRLAYDRTADRTAAPSRTAIVGMAVGLTALVAVAVVSASLETTSDSPQRWGWTWSSKPDNGGDLPRQDHARLLEEPGLEAVAVFETGSVVVDDLVFQGFSLTDRKGHTTFEVIDGRLPVGPAEVALGGRTLDELDREVGEALTAQNVDGADADLLIVGQAVLPSIEDNPHPGDGAVLTPAGLRTLTEEDNRQLVLTYGPGVDARDLEADLEDRYGLAFPPGYARPHPPGRLLNMADNRPLVVGIGLFVAGLGVAGMAHALVVSGRRQRRAFAVLRSLGLRRRQVRRAVVLQALAIAAAGAVVGVPVGVVAGRAAWLAAVGNLGMIDDPVTPGGRIALVVAATGAVVLFVAFVPAWLSAHRRPATALRAE